MMFEELLKEFKENEAPETLVALDEPIMRNALVAWRSVSVKKKSGSLVVPDSLSETQQWNWMWSVVEYDSKEFGIIAGLQEHEVNRVLKRLIGLRLIYPDGMVCKLASQYLQGIIMAKLPKQKKKKE